MLDTQRSVQRMFETPRSIQRMLDTQRSVQQVFGSMAWQRQPIFAAHTSVALQKITATAEEIDEADEATVSRGEQLDKLEAELLIHGVALTIAVILMLCRSPAWRFPSSCFSRSMPSRRRRPSRSSAGSTGMLRERRGPGDHPDPRSEWQGRAAGRRSPVDDARLCRPTRTRSPPESS
jgi:hypothetical protein